MVQNSFSEPQIDSYVEISDYVIANNTILDTSYYNKGTSYILYATIGNISLLNNTATGLLLDNSQVKFTGIASYQCVSRESSLQKWGYGTMLKFKHHLVK